MQLRSELIVEANILLQNLEKLRSITPQNEIIPMVKADGYGHGATEITRVLVRHGVKTVGVATIIEALALRRELGSLEFEILVFSDVQLHDEENYQLYQSFRLTPVISNLDDLKLFLQTSAFKNAPLFIKFNTGMNRLGIHHLEVSTVAKLILQNGRKSIKHALSHFACASQNINLASNQRQYENFKEVLKNLRSHGLEIEETSMSNSGAIEQGAGLEFSHVRPGLMMYGPSSLIPSLKSAWNGSLISSLKVRVLQSMEMKQGQPVGYGATPLARDGQMLIAAIGYGDGFNNRFQKAKFEVLSGGNESIPVDVVGRVNMDMVQLLALSGTKIKSNEVITFWHSGAPKGFDLLCESSKTIPYEVFCQLSGRVPRIFKLA